MIVNHTRRHLHVVLLASLTTSHIHCATLHIDGADERRLEFGDRHATFASLLGGEGYINSTVTVTAPDFVTNEGVSVDGFMALIREQQAIIVAQSAEIQELKQFTGMLPPPAPPPMAPVIAVQPGTNTLQNAHDQASSGSILLLAAGTYIGSGSSNTAMLEITKSIVLRPANPDAGAVVLDGQDARRVVLISNSNAKVELNGLEITRGRIVSQSGAGVSVMGSASAKPFVNIHQCKIHTGQVWGGGGPSGAGVYVSSAVVLMSDTKIYNNFATDRWNGRGGGISMRSDGILNMSSCEIYNNRATGRGGGVDLHSGSQLHVRNSFIHDNTAGSTAWWGGNVGGGLWLSGATSIVSIIGTNVTDNVATNSGSNSMNDIHVEANTPNVCTLDTNVGTAYGTISTCPDS